MTDDGPRGPDGRPPGTGGDRDGVRVTERPAGRGRLLGVVALVAVVAFVGYRLLGPAAEGASAADAGAQGGGPADGGSAAPAAPAAAPSDGGDPARRNAGSTAGVSGAAGPAADGEDPTPDLSDYMRPGEAPTMGQVIEGLHQRGIRTGLGAFNPPGTSPPLLGLEVPEGFVLPEGYVRHHQATDDGQRIAPILMFSPDRQFVEVRGRRVAIPADRLVTPELAPPGMPLRLVRIPPPRPGSGGP